MKRLMSGIGYGVISLTILNMLIHLFLIIHMIFSVFIIFAVCSIIECVRKKIIEDPIFTIINKSK